MHRRHPLVVLLEAVEEHREEADEEVAAVVGEVAALVRLSDEVVEEDDQAVRRQPARVRVVQVVVAQVRLQHDDERRELRRLLQIPHHEVAREEAGVLRRRGDRDVDRDAARRLELYGGGSGGVREKRAEEGRQGRGGGGGNVGGGGRGGRAP